MNVSAVVRQMGVSPSWLFNRRRLGSGQGNAGHHVARGKRRGRRGAATGADRRDLNVRGAVFRVATDFLKADLRRVLRAVRQS